MKAVRVHEYGKPPSIDEIPDPGLQGPLDVIVHVDAAGVCRTDLHIIEGQWAEASGVDVDQDVERALQRGLRDLVDRRGLAVLVHADCLHDRTSRGRAGRVSSARGTWSASAPG